FKLKTFLSKWHVQRIQFGQVKGEAGHTCILAVEFALILYRHCNINRTEFVMMFGKKIIFLTMPLSNNVNQSVCIAKNSPDKQMTNLKDRGISGMSFYQVKMIVGLLILNYLRK